MRKRSILIIFITVFVDLVGFGMVFPLLPKYVRDFGAPGWMLGGIVASYSLMQFLFAPAWGRFSDRVGRRPVLLVSTAGFVVSYVMFAIGSGLKNPAAALWVILASRVFSGICGANITVAQAYIADVSTPEQRSRRMGLIGMAFGLGFICGPAIAVAALLMLGLPGPGWVAAIICLANFILAWFMLGESLPPGSKPPVRSGGRFDHWREVMARPKIGLLVGVFFLATFAFTCFETTLGLLVAENFHFAPEGTDSEIAIAFLFGFCGLVGALVQGGAIGRLVKALGEPRLIALSLVLTAISLAPLPFFGGHFHAALTQLWKDPNVSGWRFFVALFTGGGASWFGLLATLAVLSIGSGLTRPPLFGLLSSLTPANEQGFTIGIAQSSGALARIAGPVFASTLYDWHPAVPYAACAALALGACLWAWGGLRGEQPQPAGSVAPSPSNP